MKPVPYVSTGDYYAPSIITPGAVRFAYNSTFDKNIPPKFIKLDLLWDTGAVISMISNRLVKLLGLVPIGIDKTINSHNEINVYRYKINLLLPNKIEISELPVIADDLPGVDFLVGMDVIRLCDFAITHPQRQTKFAIQTPSVADVQF